MRLTHLIGTLLLLQATLLVHLLWTVSGSGVTAEAVSARGGAVTAVTLQAQRSDWGGVHGMLTPNGQQLVALAPGSIAPADIRYDDQDNNCSRTELLAAVAAVQPQDVTPIAPQDADAILGYSPASPFSVTRMFDEQLLFDLAGTQQLLWATRTRGALTDFLQGVAQANGNVVFVTQTVRNGQAYDGTPAEYQLLLPAGTWTVGYDATDSCTLLDEILTEEQQPTGTHLQAVAPTRVCVGEETTMYAVARDANRLQCAVEDVGTLTCAPLPDVEATITFGGEAIVSLASAADGAIRFTPAVEGTYFLSLRTDGAATRRLFTAQRCLQPSAAETLGEVREYPESEITPALIGTSDPSRQEATRIQRSVHTDFILILWITTLTVALAVAAYYQQHKDDSVRLLKLRIWWRERIWR